MAWLMHQPVWVYWAIGLPLGIVVGALTPVELATFMYPDAERTKLVREWKERRARVIAWLTRPFRRQKQ